MTKRNTFSALGLAFILSASTLFPSAAPAWAASSHSRLHGDTYQLADGTAVHGVFARGIDISHWQGEIDWEQVSRNDIEFVMLGTRYQGEVDPMFYTNAAGIVDAGLKLGAYIYSYALTVEEAEAEADFILDLIKDYPISYPVAFDIEDSSQASLDPTQISAMINAFCKKIEDAGYHPLVYANDYWLANRIDLSQLKYDVWVARYEVPHEFEQPVMWQATSTGSVDGINGNVDINFQYEDFSEHLPADLWRTINGKTYYYKDYVMQKNSWIHDGSGWFFLDDGGQPATGWLNQNDITYYLDPNSGRMTQGWLLSSDGWRYFDLNGAMQTGWLMDQGAWYHIGDDGIMNTGMIEDGGKWYFLRDSGSMVTGWRMLGDAWYYFGGDGSMQTGWVGDDSAWYYLNPENGKMYANTQITVDGIVYNADANGVCHEVVPEATADGAEGTADGSGTGESDAAGVVGESVSPENTAGSVQTAPVPGTSNNGIESAVVVGAGGSASSGPADGPGNHQSAAIVSGSSGNAEPGSGITVIAPFGN